MIEDENNEFEFFHEGYTGDWLPLLERIQTLIEEESVLAPIVTQQDLIKKEFHKQIEERQDNRTYLPGDEFVLTLKYQFP